LNSSRRKDEGSKTGSFFPGDLCIIFSDEDGDRTAEGETASSFAAHLCILLLRSLLKRLADEGAQSDKSESETYLRAFD
jgi:hypothetical protein